jgi:hypothetical protein
MRPKAAWILGGNALICDMMIVCGGPVSDIALGSPTTTKVSQF